MLDQVMHRVITVHAADSDTRGKLHHVLLGTALTPFAAMFDRLVRAGWDGWMCMEEASGKGREGVELAARFIRQTWESAVARSRLP